MKLELNNRNRTYMQAPETKKIPIPENTKIMRISSMIIKNAQGDLVYDSGEYMFFMKSDVQMRYFERFFEVEGEIHVEALKECVESLRRLREVIAELGIYFENSSIVILFSKAHRKFILKYVDFSYFPQPLKKGDLDGLDEAILIFSTILSKNLAID